MAYNEKFWCSICESGMMSTREQLDSHINGAKHKKKAFTKGVPYNWDGHSVQSAATLSTVINVQEKNFNIGEDGDFPSLGGPVAAAPRAAPAPVAPKLNVKNEGDFPSLGQKANPPPGMGGQMAWQMTPGSGDAVPLVQGRGRGRGRGILRPDSQPAPGTVTMPTPQVYSAPSQPTMAQRRPQREVTGKVTVISQEPTAVPKSKEDQYQKVASANMIFDEFKQMKKTALVAINEIAVCMRWSLEYPEVTPLKKPFAVNCMIAGECLGHGEGTKKQEAKLQAAQDAMHMIQKKLHGDSGRPVGAEDSMQGKSRENPMDSYARLTREKVDKLIKSATGVYEQPTRFAAFILTMYAEQPATDGVVVAIGTGRGVTRLTQKELVEEKGYHLVDCNALVIARRALQGFLWSQVKTQLDNSEDPEAGGRRLNCLEMDTEGWFRMKEGYRLHLFLSHAPAGDAVDLIEDRWQDPPELPLQDLTRDLDGKLDPIMTLRSSNAEQVGSLRYLVPGERDAAVPLVGRSGKIPQKGQLALVMSPSDKLMRWIHIGFQGALLGFFMRPVYLYSVQFGMKYHHGHAARALLTRVPGDQLTHMPDGYGPFCRQDCYLGRVQKLPSYSKVESSYSMNWFLNPSGHGLEVVDVSRGLVDLRSPYKVDSELAEIPSRLTRMYMLKRCDVVFELASEFYARFPQKKRGGDLRAIWEAMKTEGSNSPHYFRLKQMSKAYQDAKRTLLHAISSAGLGTWLANPERQQFCLEDYHHEEEEVEEDEGWTTVQMKAR